MTKNQNLATHHLVTVKIARILEHVLKQQLLLISAPTWKKYGSKGLQTFLRNI
jgi:hypothetical protein